MIKLLDSACTLVVGKSALQSILDQRQTAASPVKPELTSEVQRCA
jgi:hypothetical protein